MVTLRPETLARLDRVRAAIEADGRFDAYEWKFCFVGWAARDVGVDGECPDDFESWEEFGYALLEPAAADLLYAPLWPAAFRADYHLGPKPGHVVAVELLAEVVRQGGLWWAEPSPREES